MSKIYFVGVNWDKMKSGVENSYLWLQEHDVADSFDMAQWVETVPYSKGWKLYPFSRKKDRDEVVRTTMNMWVEIKKGATDE